MTSIDPPGRARLIALRAIAAVFALLILVVVNGQLLLPFLSWLPDSTLTGLGYPPGDLGWLVQGTGITFGHITLLVCVALQIFRPVRNVAPLWLVAFLMGVQMIYDATQGTVGDPLWWVVYAMTVAIIALHPRRLAPLPPWNWPALAFAVIGAGPLLAYAWSEFRQQSPANGDNFHFGMALITTLAVFAAVIGSSSVPGRRVAACLGGLCIALIGIASIAKPTLASAFPVGWAWAALAWGVVFIAIAVRPVAINRRPASTLAPTQVS